MQNNPYTINYIIMLKCYVGYTTLHTISLIDNKCMTDIGYNT